MKKDEFERRRRRKKEKGKRRKKKTAVDTLACHFAVDQ